MQLRPKIFYAAPRIEKAIFWRILQRGYMKRWGIKKSHRGHSLPLQPNFLEGTAFAGFVKNITFRHFMNDSDGVGWQNYRRNPLVFVATTRNSGSIVKGINYTHMSLEKLSWHSLKLSASCQEFRSQRRKPTSCF